MEGEGGLVPFCAAVGEFVKAGMRVDILMKSVLGLARLASLYCADETMRQNFSAFGLAIINCRMLANHFRHVISLSQALAVCRTRRGPPLSWLFLFLSFLLRSLEQVFGDLGYYQMTFMHHWNRGRLSYWYWFYKSLSLTCGLLHELVGLRATLSAPQWKTRTKTERYDVIKAKCVSVLRYLLDMVVYYQWVPWYNPSKTVQYAAAAVSGALGCKVAWNQMQTTRAAEEKAKLAISGKKNDDSSSINNNNNNNSNEAVVREDKVKKPGINAPHI